MMKDDITITRTLLETPESELTAEELAAVAEYKEDVRKRHKRLEHENDKIVNDCEILCSGNESFPIPDYGWINPVTRLCYGIESLNYDFRKCGFKVVLQQSKEKFGGLRFYTHIESTPTGLCGFISRCLSTAAKWLSRLDFGKRVVVYEPKHTTIEWQEITEEQFREGKNEIGVRFHEGFPVIRVSSRDCVTNADSLTPNIFTVEENGKFYYAYLLHHSPKTRVEYTRHRFLRCIMDLLFDLSVMFTPQNSSKRNEVMLKELNFRVDELVEAATKSCMNVCQHCGMPFDVSSHGGSNRCETQGWYTYVCERCAIASGVEYIMDGTLYKEGIKIKSVSAAKPVSTKPGETDEK